MEPSVGLVPGAINPKTKPTDMMVYYIACLVYSLFMSSLSWMRNGRDGGLGITPGMDSIAIVLLCWALAPVDLFIRLMRVVKEAESYRIRKRRMC